MSDLVPTPDSKHLKQFSRYVALGDSNTEGLDDPYPDGNGFRGWADRLAEKLAALNPDFTYANLAVRGRLIAGIHDEQMEPALAMNPDLASVIGGVNDVLRPKVDLEAIGGHMETMQRALIERGATVIAMTLPDLSSTMFVARLVSKRLVAYNQMMRDVAARTGAVLIDMEREPVAEDPRLWSIDRLHASPLGHERIAVAVAHALGVPGSDLAAAQAELPKVTKLPLYRLIPKETAWAWRYFAPWIMRRLRGQSSGDGITAKRPFLTSIDPVGSEASVGSSATG